LNGCVGDLTALMEGRQLYSTHIEKYSSDVVQVDVRYEYMGHLLTNSALNLDGIKKKFLDSLLNNINKRYGKKLNSTKKFSSKKTNVFKVYSNSTCSISMIKHRQFLFIHSESLV
jgi:hypothetical protein